MPLHVVNHPAASHFLTILRDKSTPPETFRRVSDVAATYVIIEATRNLAVEPVAIETPLEPMTGSQLAQGIVVVPILRAGLSMMDPVLSILPDVAVGYVGLERDEATAEARTYYLKLPELAEKKILLVDPMLATGGSATHAIDFIKEKGGKDITFICMVAAPEGVQQLEDLHPDVPIVAGALDRELNEKKYICPGLGDYGDRLYFT